MKIHSITKIIASGIWTQFKTRFLDELSGLIFLLTVQIFVIELFFGRLVEKPSGYTELPQAKVLRLDLWCDRQWC